VTTSWQPEWAIHPGETLAETMQERELTQTALGKLTGFSQKHVSYVITGKAGIGVEFALALERVLGIAGEFWMSLQAHYDLQLARGYGPKERA
jgi:HTH-type transcriptional regulator / antitoxin HigA